MQTIKKLLVVIIATAKAKTANLSLSKQSDKTTWTD